MARTFQFRPRLRRIFERLDPSALAFSADDLEITAADVGLESPSRTHLAFGIYSPEGVQRALTAYGLFSRLADRGLREVEVRIELEDPFRPRFMVWSVPHHLPVIDVTLARVSGAQLGLAGDAARAPLLFIESIQLQHPARRFDWTRPPLPEQAHPGLSLFSEVLQVLALLAKRIGADGVGLVPSSFHAAWIYERYFQFVEPLAQGRFEALRYSWRLRPLWLLSWAIALGCVRTGDGQPYAYAPGPMLCPLTDALARVFEAPAYVEAVRREAVIHYEIDGARLRERFPWEQMPPGPPPERLRAVLGTRPEAAGA